MSGPITSARRPLPVPGSVEERYRATKTVLRTAREDLWEIEEVGLVCASLGLDINEALAYERHAD